MTCLTVMSFSSTDVSQALVITEVGSSRDPEIIDLVMKNLRSLVEKTVTVHG